MASSVPALSSSSSAGVQPPGQQSSLSSRVSQKVTALFTPEVKIFLQIITQIAIRTLFVLGAILMVASSFPLSFLPVVLPITAIGSAFLAAFFFQPQAETPPSFSKDPRTPLFHPVARAYLEGPSQMPSSLSVDAPRGIDRKGTNNCCMSVVAQELVSEPRIRQWVAEEVRRLRADSVLMQNLQSYYTRIARQQILHSSGNKREIGAASQIEDLPPIQNPLSAEQQAVFLLDDFFRRYQDSMRNQGTLVSSFDPQQMRTVAHRLPGPEIRASSFCQEDASEVWSKFLQILPAEHKIVYEEIRTYGCADLPKPLDYPHCGSHFSTAPRSDMATFFSLSMREEAIDLEDSIPEMLKRFCKRKSFFGFETKIRRSAIQGSSAVEVEYPLIEEQIRLRQAPPAFRFLIKRMARVRPDSIFTHIPFLSSLFPSLQETSIKLETRIRVPSVLNLREILPADSLPGEGSFVYQLTGFFPHIGESMDAGHYIYYRKINNHYYKIDDERVMPLSREEWLKEAQTGYGFTYLRVD